MAGNVEKKLAELGITLPSPKGPVANYVPFVRTGNFMVVSGQVCFDSEGNLVYACIRCNQYKGDFAPDGEDIQSGRRALHPLLDDVSLHVHLNESSGQLEPLTETGRFHITLLQLNRPALVRHRLRRRLAELAEERARLLAMENERLRYTIEAQRAYIDRLRRMLGLPPRTEDR